MASGKKIRVWRWGEIPAFLRFICPWWLVYWLNDNYDFCWVKLYLWKLYGEECGTVDTVCFAHVDGPDDYCGKYPAETARQFGDMRPIPEWARETHRPQEGPGLT